MYKRAPGRAVPHESTMSVLQFTTESMALDTPMNYSALTGALDAVGLLLRDRTLDDLVVPPSADYPASGFMRPRGRGSS